jgi:UDP-glucose 4-epimerase
MRVVITGASGNVGLALLRALASEPNLEIVGLARRVPRDPLPEVPTVEWHAIDVATSDLVPSSGAPMS